MKTNSDSMLPSIAYRKNEERNLPLTPIEQLLADKNCVEAKCGIWGKKLQEDFEYIHNNATSLLFSGLTSLLFPSGNNKKTPETQSIALIDGNQSTQNNNRLSVSDLFVIARKMTPVVWEIVQPLLINWGIKKAKSLLFRLFSRKKSVPSAN